MRFQTGGFCLPYGPGYYSCQAVNANNCSAVSNTFAYEVAGIRNIIEQHIGLYPNPVGDDATLSFESPFTGLIKVMSIAGNVIEQRQLNSDISVEINVGQLVPAIYVLMINTCNGNEFAKFVVAR